MLSSGSPLTWSLPRFFFFLRFYMYFINVKYKIGEYNKGVNQEFFHTTSACQKHSGQSYVPKWECWCVYVCKMFSQSNVYSIPLQKKKKPHPWDTALMLLYSPLCRWQWLEQQARGLVMWFFLELCASAHSHVLVGVWILQSISAQFPFQGGFLVQSERVEGVLVVLCGSALRLDTV